MRGRAVFYPVTWDDNGLPAGRRVQNVFGVRCEPTLPYDPAFVPPSAPDPRRPVPVSRRGFVELCERLATDDEAVFAAVCADSGCRWTGRWRTPPSTRGPGAPGRGAAAVLRPARVDLALAAGAAQLELEPTATEPAVLVTLGPTAG